MEQDIRDPQSKSLPNLAYSICRDTFRLAEISEKETGKTFASEELRSQTLAALFEISRIPSKTGRGSEKRMKSAYKTFHKLSILLDFFQDLKYIDQDKASMINSNLQYVLAKLRNIIKYSERKAKETK